jgi:hypothetical protein
MSTVINFLESVGQDSKLRHAENGEVEAALAELQIEGELQVAILANDRLAIERLLSARATICCGMAPGKKEEDEEEESPSKDDDEIRAITAARAA